MGVGRFFFDQFNAFFDRFKRLGEYEPTPEEILAGVQTRFEEFGMFPTVKALVKDFGVTGQFVDGKYVHGWDLVLKIPAQTVYYNLLINFEQSEYERDLMNIHKQK